MTLVPDADYLHLELVFNPQELQFFAELDLNQNGLVDSDELERVGYASKLGNIQSSRFCQS